MLIRPFAFSLALLTATCLTSADVIDETALRLPSVGDASAQVLTPSLLELTFITTQKPGTKPVPPQEQLTPAQLRVELGGSEVSFSISGFKRRALYAPLKRRDLRIATHVYVTLNRPLVEGRDQRISVVLKPNELTTSGMTLQATADPLRYSPAIHVNQEGYTPKFPKVAIVGYYLGSAGELPLAADTPFELVDAKSGQSVFRGSLRPRMDLGFASLPRPYQSVAEADFSAFDTPGEYRLAVPGLGASLPFRIDEGILIGFARTLALGLYHQRCGASNELPFTRFVHAACHTHDAEVPMPQAQFAEAWKIIADLEKDSVKPEFPEQQLKSPRDQYFPFVKRGKVNVTGGHHDAGDYSRYTTNSASLVHALVFAVDSLPGVAELDNLGLPESGDGISDVLQEAKWESDFLSRIQDEDGGFYFLVYPRDRRYENDVLPDRGDRQIVWPKTTASTAAAVAALAQCAGSPEFKKHFPEEAKRYLEQARLGWTFLLQAIAKHGDRRAYQRLTHYGDQFLHYDELAWAASELFVATGDPAYEKKLFEWFPNPADPETWQWNWRRAAFSYGNVLRSYAFATTSGRLPRNKLDSAYLKKCENELLRAGEAALRSVEQSAYGISFPEATKRIGRAGWYFASDDGFDLTVAHQLQRRPKFAAAVLSNLNYEAGTNPVNRTFITGIGLRRQREIVHQYAQNDVRVLPPSGIPIGILHSDYAYLDPYKTELKDLSWPKDDAHNGRYPLYDRWADAYNFNTEFVVTNQGRMLASITYWAAQTSLKNQPWKSATAKIVGNEGIAPLNEPVTFRLEAPGIDLSRARIVWEARDQEPAVGPSFKVRPRTSGKQWVEAEATLVDGRRLFAHATFSANAPIVYWIDGSIPKGATEFAQGGDSWDWRKPASKPRDLPPSHAQRLQHESALVEGIHEHGFENAEATLEIERGDILFAYVFIDPNNRPKTLMMEWNDGASEHRAFWGPNHIPYGKPNTEGQRDMGPLPPAGKWVRLEVPAKSVGLEGRTIHGMIFRTHGGRVRWDAAGKMSAASTRSKG